MMRIHTYLLAALTLHATGCITMVQNNGDSATANEEGTSSSSSGEKDPTGGLHVSLNELCMLALNDPDQLQTNMDLGDPDCAQEAAKYNAPMIKGCDNLCYPLSRLGDNHCDNPKKEGGKTVYLDCPMNPEGLPLAWDCWDCNQNIDSLLCQMTAEELHNPLLGEAECAQMTQQYGEAAVVGCDGECHLLSWVGDGECHDPWLPDSVTQIDMHNCPKFGAGLSGKGDCNDCIQPQ